MFNTVVTFGVSENTFGLFEITLGLSEISAVLSQIRCKDKTNKIALSLLSVNFRFFIIIYCIETN